MVPAFQLDDSALVSVQEHLPTHSDGFWRSCRSLDDRIPFLDFIIFSDSPNSLLVLKVSKTFVKITPFQDEYSRQWIVMRCHDIRPLKLLQDLQKPPERVRRCSWTLTSVESSNWNAGTIGMDPILYPKKRQRRKKNVTLLEKSSSEWGDVMNSSELWSRSIHLAGLEKPRGVEIMWK